jgi:myo-inositol-1(or 4)-monophosphatase
MQKKIEYLKAYLPQLRTFLLSQTIDEVRIKEDSFDNIVTNLDLMVQDHLTQALLSAFPDTAFFSEEDESHEVSEKMWVIDPIDGTKNFYRRKEDYAISVAYYENKIPVFGFVYDVAKDLLFLGIQNEGAWVNGKRIEALSEKTLHQSILDMNIKTFLAINEQGGNGKKLNDEIFAHRCIGSGALSLCRIALGTHDIYISSHLKFWDYAAAKIILEACGGVVRLPFEANIPLSNVSVFLIACTGEKHVGAIMETLFGKEN